MPYLELPDGVPLHDDGQGSGRAVVLIRERIVSGSFWQQNVPALAAGDRVVTPDLRGRGASGKTDAGHMLAQFARDVRSLLDHLAIDEVRGIGASPR